MHMMKRWTAVFLLLALVLGCIPAHAEDELILRAGGSFGLAVSADGVIWGWGDNTSGQLGDGTNKRRRQPGAAAVGLDGSQVADIRCGNVNTLFLMKDGTVYTCGANNYGQQGVKDAPAYVFEPMPIPGLANIVKIASGYGQCLALTADGCVWAWGRNSNGQIGNGQRRNAQEPLLLELENIVDIQCGGKFCLALASDGTLYGWGENANNQLLTATKGANVLTPAVLDTGLNIVKIACSGSTAFALDADGVLWSWGKNDYVQTGNKAARAKCAAPVQVNLPAPIAITAIEAYNTHTSVLTADGTVWMWGNVYTGQSGTGKRISKTEPLEAFPAGVVSTAVGSLQSYVLLDDGRVLSAGYNKYGQTGTHARALELITVWTDTGLNLQTGAWVDPCNK